jgi:hypothetical protein
MDTNQLQRDKLNIINWITEIQDASIVEKVKEIMSLDSKPYKLTNEQQKIVDSQIGLDSNLYVEADKFVSDIKVKYEL